MADISKINNVALASVSKINNRTLANNDKVMGIIKPTSAGTAHTFLTKVDTDWNGINSVYGNARLPQNWNGSTSNVVFGSTTANRSWDSRAGSRTTSNNTGPDSGHDSSRSDGQELANDDYLYTETSGNNTGFPNKRFLVRTPELDFSNALANNTLKLYFWFHAFGATIGSFGVSATDNASSAGDDTLGLHFTSDTDGGATITFWDDASDDGSSTSSGVRITGQQQTQGDADAGNGDAAHWRLGVVDLNSIAGQSSVYLWFFHKGGSSFTGDFAIDDVEVTGEI